MIYEYYHLSSTTHVWCCRQELHANTVTPLYLILITFIMKLPHQGVVLTNVEGYVSLVFIIFMNILISNSTSSLLTLASKYEWKWKFDVGGGKQVYFARGALTWLKRCRSRVRSRCDIVDVLVVCILVLEAKVDIVDVLVVCIVVLEAKVEAKL